ncbi:tripartite tricarboxylate transporter substrate binding protein [Halorubrum gandharaense]
MERRNFLRTTGAIGTAGIAGLAGCADEEPDDTGNGNGDAPADEFPTDDLTWMIPWSEGGGTDTYARQIAVPMEESIGESITIDNRPGAGSLVGSEWLANQDPDGYTFGTINSAGAHFTWRAEGVDDWHIEEDFEPFAYSGTFGYTLIVNDDIADEYGIDDYGSLRDAYQDGDIETFSYQGAGSDSHLSTLLLRDQYGLEYENSVPYDGGGPTMEAVISGEVAAGIATNTSAVNAEESGEASTIVNLMDIDLTDTWPEIDRIDNYGDGLGWITEFTQTQLAPAGTPDDVLDTLSAAVEEAALSDDVQEWSEDTGNIVQYGDREDAQELWTGILDEMETNVEEAIGGFDEFLEIAEEES